MMDKIKIKKLLLIAAGSLSVVLGAVGLAIPVLPTTPFLLLACFCFVRSSESLYQWLIHHKVFGKYIYNYVTYKAVTKKAKISALILLWASLSISIFVVNNLHVRLLLLAVGIGVTVHLLYLKTI